MNESPGLSLFPEQHDSSSLRLLFSVFSFFHHQVYLSSYTTHSCLSIGLLCMSLSFYLLWTSQEDEHEMEGRGKNPIIDCVIRAGGGYFYYYSSDEEKTRDTGVLLCNLLRNREKQREKKRKEQGVGQRQEAVKEMQHLIQGEEDGDIYSDQIWKQESLYS